MAQVLQELLPILPYLLLIGVAVFYVRYVRKALKASMAEWKKEEERKAKVRALAPQPSYEERMGVQYGPTGSHDV